MSEESANKLRDMASRIREMREIVGYTVENMAKLVGVSVAEYKRVEAAELDPTFNFLHQGNAQSDLW